MDVELSYKTVRSTYLLTYSKADLKKFRTRQTFADAVVKCFPDSEKNKLVQWACAIEEHQDGSPHFHMSIKFSGNRRWKEGKNRFYRVHGVSIHFSSFHDDYPSAYGYLTKHDSDILHSENHPPLFAVTARRTRNATVARRKRKSARDNSESGEAGPSNAIAKKKRLTAGMVADFVVKNQIHTEKEMYEALNLQKKEGQTDLHDFILNKPPKFLQDILSRAWKIENALESKERDNCSRMDILKDALHKECIQGCNGRWLVCANETLRNNKVNPYVFADAIRSALLTGRAKGNNLMITGKGDCAKTFLFLPLTVVFHAFTNPAKTSFAWVGVEQKEIIFLNDIRWTEKMIDWSDFLNLLDGNDVTFPRPKNFNDSDIKMKRESKVPIFATSIDNIRFIGDNSDVETDMMNRRWRIFNFFHQIPKAKQVTLEPCAKCFADMAMVGSEFD